MTTAKTTLGLIAVVALPVLIGCGSKQDDWLTVTDDPKAIAEARELADRLQNQEMDALLAHLDDPFLDTDAFAVLKGTTDRELDQLQQIAHANLRLDAQVEDHLVLRSHENEFYGRRLCAVTIKGGRLALGDSRLPVGQRRDDQAQQHRRHSELSQPTEPAGDRACCTGWSGVTVPPSRAANSARRTSAGRQPTIVLTR